MTAQFLALTNAVNALATTVALIPDAITTLVAQKEDPAAVTALTNKIATANQTLSTALVAAGTTPPVVP